MNINWNDGWQYFDYFDDRVFDTMNIGKSVRLPHTGVVLPLHYFDEKSYQFVSAYRRVLTVDKKDVGKTFLAVFEAVAHRSVVYVNKQRVLEHKCGYTAFTADISSFLTSGDNVVVVEADSRESNDLPPFGGTMDYLAFCGMYREAHLEIKDGVYIKDVCVFGQPYMPVKIEAELCGVTNAAEVKFKITGSGGETVAEQSEETSENKIAVTLDIPKMRLWNLDDPYLYKLTVTAGSDEYVTSFGIRSASFCTDGFYLNGKKVKIIGLNRHQSYPYVGYAMPQSMQRFDAKILKNELCVNAVRTSHYPQSRHFIDECDRLGLLVFTEIPGWQHIGGEEWQKIALTNAEEMVMQYRNHPSIILWGVRINESQDCHELYEKTNAAVHKLDKSRQTGGVRYLQHSELLEDVYTYNDFSVSGAANPDKICGRKARKAPYLITEYNGHMYPTKTFDDETHRVNHMLRYAAMLDKVFANDRISGAFGWCMADYNTHSDFGSGDRICYHGVTDIFRNHKSAASVFSAAGNEDYLFVASNLDKGDYAGGNTGGVWCVTNADFVEVYKNGEFVKSYTHASSPFKYLPFPPILIDDMIGGRLAANEKISPKQAELIKSAFKDVKKYGLNKLPLASKIKAVRIIVGSKLTLGKLTDLYGKYEEDWGSLQSEVSFVAVKDGKKVKTVTIGGKNKVILRAEANSDILYDGDTYDVAAVRIRAEDGYGNLLSYADDVVSFRTEGAIKIIGPDKTALKGGLAGTYVQTVGEAGKARLYVNDIPVDFTVKTAG